MAVAAIGPFLDQVEKTEVSPLILYTVRRNPTNLKVAGVPVTGDRLVTVVRTAKAVFVSR